MAEQPILEVKDLKTHFNTEDGLVTAVEGVSFQARAGEIIGLVGESGCGKSVTAQSILRLFDEKKTVKYEGEILFKGKNLLKAPLSEMQKIRGNEVSMIFQDSLSSLNPVFTIGHQIIETIMLHQGTTKKEAYKKALEMLKLTGIPAPERRIAEYPHELSGGMRQRAMIAIALSCQPKLLIADEPTTALDVTIQAQILKLVLELNRELHTSVIFITHDLGVVAEICSRVLVMYLGQIMEASDVDTLFTEPLHPYTRGLIKSIPQIDGDKAHRLHVIKGTIPPIKDRPPGCRFASRCAYAEGICFEKKPELEQIGPGHSVRCWRYKELPKEEYGLGGA